MSVSVSNSMPGVSTGASTTAPEANGFDRFEFHPSIERGIRAMGFTTPRPIQAETIEASLDGRDVLGLAQTGTGKTAAFALPILDLLLDEPGRGPRALILAPTRELANQIGAEIRNLAKFTKLKMVTIYGGMPMRGQINALRNGPEIVVGCPGRVLDLIQQGQLKLGACETLVLDEADHMFDMGFLPDIRKILKSLPEDRQNLLFSATMPKEVEGLVSDFLPGAERVQIGSRGQAPSTITHRFVAVPAVDKQAALKRILKRERGKVLIFVNKKIGCERLGGSLKREGLPADSIHGDKSAEARHACLQGFSRGKIRFLIATDVAARGIDVDDIDLVVNYDFPLALEDYVHRSGRTGRAGREGRALSLVAPMEKRLHATVAAHLRGEEVESVPRPGASRGRGRARPGGRSSKKGAKKGSRKGSSRLQRAAS